MAQLQYIKLSLLCAQLQYIKLFLLRAQLQYIKLSLLLAQLQYIKLFLLLLNYNILDSTQCNLCSKFQQSHALWLTFHCALGFHLKCQMK